jgi:signal transduction histidine kinase
MLPSNIFEKEFASFLTREELERQVMEKTKNLEKEKESVDAKIRERTFEYRAERDKLKLIAENMSEGVLLLDPYRSVLFRNTKLNNIFAIPEDSTEEIVLAGFDRLISSADARILMDESLKKGTYSTTIENSGRIYSVSCIYISDKDKGNNISGFLWWIRDITEEKSLERKKSEFISIAAHQLRTPLSGIKWTLNMMVNEELGPLSDDQKVFLLKLQESNDRMIHLVNDLLQADRLETDKTEYSFEKVDFGGMVKNISEDFKISAKNNGLSLYVSVKQNNDLSVYGDKEKLHSVIQNLVDNAIKYTLKGGSINVSSEINKEGRVMLSVSDTGIGIIKSQQEKIFGRFFRGSNALKIKTDGTGLGLYIVKQIVERHGGNVSFESTEGVGSRFIVTLPHFEDKGKKKNK